MSAEQKTVFNAMDNLTTERWAEYLYVSAVKNGVIFDYKFPRIKPKPLTRKQKLKRLWNEITYRVSGAWDVITGKAYVSHGEEW